MWFLIFSVNNKFCFECDCGQFLWFLYRFTERAHRTSRYLVQGTEDILPGFIISELILNGTSQRSYSIKPD